MTGRGRRAGAPGAGQGGAMSGLVQVVVYPPSPSGGRRVRADGEILGLARSARDVAELVRRAGMTG